MNFPDFVLDKDYNREIHLLFSRSKYGKKLREEVRFGLFKPESMSRFEWVKVLGRDVNNLYHMPFTTRLTHNFLKKCEIPPNSWKKEIPELAKFNDFEKKTLILVAQIHDWAEAKIGDIPKPQKTEKQETEEIEILKQMIEELLSKKHKSLVSFLQDAVEEVIARRESKLGTAFDAIENLGYHKVAIRAWLKRNKYEGELKDKLISLATAEDAPLRFGREKIILYAGIYPPVHDFLTNPVNQRVIKQALSVNGVQL